MGLLSKNLINFGDRVFGLDLSDLSIKVFQLDKDGKQDVIRSFSSIEVPPGVIDDGRIVDKDKVVYAIKRAVESAVPRRINTKKVICSLPESKAFLRIISIPKMSQEEAFEAVKWEIEASIPLAVDQVYFDWQFIEGDKRGKQDVLTVAVSKEIVDDIMAVLESAGLEAYGLELESIASVRSLIKNDSEKSDTSLIVDLGAKRTSFIIAEGNVPYFTSSIPFSSEGMTDAIAKALGIPKEEAEKIKLSRGIGQFDDDPSVFDSVKSLLENLTSEIEKSIDFFQNISKESSEINKIIICGGGSNLKGLIPFLARELGKEVEMGDPWVNLSMGNNLPPITRENSSRYSTAIGLALKGLE